MIVRSSKHPGPAIQIVDFLAPRLVNFLGVSLLCRVFSVMAESYPHDARLWHIPRGSQVPSECYTLPHQGEFQIGRDPRCQVVFSSQFYGEVSRQHVKICPVLGSQGDWQVFDLNSSNGTYVNHERVYHSQTLQHGDVISLGRQGPQFLFELISDRSEADRFDPQDLLETTKASRSRAMGRSYSQGSHIELGRDAGSGDDFQEPTGGVTLTQLFPILSTGGDLAQKAYLIPGIITVSFVVLMFAAVGRPVLFNVLLSTYLSGAAYYFVYQLCEKEKPWWLIAASATFTTLFLFSPALIGFLWIFRGVLPGQIPTGGPESVNILRLLIQMFFGAGLMEELIKALPVLLAYAMGSMLSSPRREAIGVQEPLDGILLGTASAIGFTLVETLGQYVPAAMNSIPFQASSLSGDLIGLQLLIPRILGSVSGHMAYSGYLGYFIGLSALKSNQIRCSMFMSTKCWQILGIGYISAAILHALWNVTGFLNPLALALVGVLSYAFLAAAILKAKTFSSKTSSKPSKKRSERSQRFSQK
jgi:RsiW-degrading membrane proteinase PrsW (M82 family)